MAHGLKKFLPFCSCVAAALCVATFPSSSGMLSSSGRSPISGWRRLVLEVSRFFLFFYRCHHVKFPRPNILTSRMNVFIDTFVTPSWPCLSSFRLLAAPGAGEVAPFLMIMQQQFAIHDSMKSGLVLLTILTV
uniref:Putative secreted protein n=1 Tax=Ixodes ricinus TaxID=34613 RepID=A0A6B0URQ7_IXORI